MSLNVLYVFDFRINLYSFSQYTDYDYKIESGKLDMKVIENSKVYVTAMRKKNLYVVAFRKLIVVEANVVEQKRDKLQLWHK